MPNLKDDALFNVVQEGIKEDIEVALANKRFRAGVMLIHAGIDAMAFLDMPAKQPDVTRADFILWAERYIRFPGPVQLTGEDLYGARCALLHAYGTDSRLSRTGKCRQVGYFDQSMPPVRYDPRISTELVMVSIAALKRAFFDGINQFLITSYVNEAKRGLVENRLQKMICSFPAENRNSHDGS
jgi:hypothetical protein